MKWLDNWAESWLVSQAQGWQRNNKSSDFLVVITNLSYMIWVRSRTKNCPWLTKSALYRSGYHQLHQIRVTHTLIYSNTLLLFKCCRGNAWKTLPTYKCFVILHNMLPFNSILTGLPGFKTCQLQSVINCATHQPANLLSHVGLYDRHAPLTLH